MDYKSYDSAVSFNNRILDHPKATHFNTDCALHLGLNCQGEWLIWIQACLRLPPKP